MEFSSSGATSTPTPFPSDDDFTAVVADAAKPSAPDESLLHGIWTRFLRDVETAQPYKPPAAVVSYRAGDVPASGCSSSTIAEFWRSNAYYCGTDSTILFDEDWLRDLHDRAGSFAPAAILAHEWGHHVQALFGPSSYSIQSELQADCFAGMYLAASEQIAPDRYVVGGNLTSALVAFFDIANKHYSAGEWFSASEHGSEQQRLMAFGTGYLPVLHGLPWCLGYGEFEPNDVVDVGPYRVLNLPGRRGEMSGDVYAIAGKRRAGLTSDDIVLAWVDPLPFEGESVTPRLLEVVWSASFPGLTPIGDAISLDANVTTGTGRAQYFENRIPQPGGGELVQSGVFALISPEGSDGGLVIVATRNEPAPAQPLDEDDLAAIEQSLVAIYQILNRLCGPGDSEEPDNPDLNVACMATQ